MPNKYVKVPAKDKGTPSVIEVLVSTETIANALVESNDPRLLANNLTTTGVMAETEIDVGSTPVIEASVAVANASISTSSKIIGGVAYKAPTGKDLDELEMDVLEVKFEPALGSMNVHIKGLEGYIADKFIIWYAFT